MSQSKFSPELAKLILESFEHNPSITSAASKAGIHYQTLRSWLEKGADGHPEYEQFAIECAGARDRFKDEVVEALRQTALDGLHPQQCKAAQLLLTHLFPTEFASVKHLVSHKADQEPEIDVSALPTDELRRLTKTLRKLKRGGDEPKKTPAVIDVVESKMKH